MRGCYLDVKKVLCLVQLKQVGVGSRWTVNCARVGEGKAYSYSCGTELDGFEGVFDLEEAAFGGESAARSC